MRAAKFLRPVVSALCYVLVGCASNDQYSFVRYGQTPDPATSRYSANKDPELNDVLALNYASSVASIMRCKFTGARITREVSSTAQIVLAALGGAGGTAFGFGSTTIAGLGLGSAGIPELQRIFGAKERAQVYQDAVRLIEEAEIEYLAHNPKPSPDELTPNGVTLFQRVTASIHVVEKTLAGNLPTVQDMQQATEQMTPTGAIPLQAGEVSPNVVTAAAGVPPGKAALTMTAAERISQAQARPRRTPSQVDPGEFVRHKDPDGPATEEFYKQLLALDSLVPDSEKPAVYQNMMDNAGIKPNDPDLDAADGTFSFKTVNEAYKYKFAKRPLLYQQLKKMQGKYKPAAKTAGAKPKKANVELPASTPGPDGLVPKTNGNPPATTPNPPPGPAAQDTPPPLQLVTPKPGH